MESQGDPARGGFGGLLERATQALKGDDSPKATQPKKITQKSKEDFSILVVSMVTLLVTFAKVDERVKPNGDEISQFSEHLSGILLRHLPISHKLSADALDIIGIMAVCAAWYSRVHTDLAELRQGSQPASQQPASQPAATVQVRKNGHVPTDPIAAASPETFNWLNGIAAKSEGLV